LTDTTPDSHESGANAADMTVGEIAELESGTAGALSPVLARLDVIVTGLICLGAAVLAFFMPNLVTSGGISFGRSYATMSPSLIPRLVFAVLTAVAAVATLAAFKRYRNQDSAPPGNEAEEFGRAAAIALIVLFYTLTVSWLGFILSTMIVATVTSIFLGLRNPLTFIPSVIIVPILIRFIFERLLFISLPRSQIESVGHIEDQVIQFLSHNLLW